MNRKIILIAVLSLLSLSGMSQVKKKGSEVKTPSAMLKSQLDSVSYAFGFNISQELKARGIKSLNYDLVAKAMADGFRGADSLLTKEECQKIIVSALVNANKEKKKGSEVKTLSVMLKSQLDSVSYAFGFNISQDLKARGIKSLNYDLVAKAMADGFRGTDSLLTKEECLKITVSTLANANREKYAPVLAEGKNFLEENKKRSGVTTLPSGLQYEVIQAGTGDKPQASDQVTVHYKGTLINGKQFDSSYDRNKPATFSLGGVIPGWTEGVQLMPVGSKYHFVIPYQLAYGERGAGQDIPPYSVLVFDIELIKIGK